jgi:spermidine/putrescine transport system ATP-binding protein
MSDASEEAIVELVNVDKFFNENRVVKNLNMKIRKGEFLTMLGPSGCGKTTTLRMIAGFEEVTDGIIRIEGENVEEKEPYERNINTVFQNYALFPHLNVFDNIAFGLVEKRVKKDEIRARVTEMLAMVQLTGFEKRRPSQMSGGQKQRVAIARALVNRPRVLLLDEPLGALDMKLRKQMQIELKHLQKKLGITFVYVTHDQEEALTMSDRIAVMNAGVLEQIGTPEEIYEHPASKFVADFIGESNILEAYINSVNGNELTVFFESGSALAHAEGFIREEMAYVSIRPEKIKCSFEAMKGFNMKVIVKEHIYIGSLIRTVMEASNGQELKMNSFAGSALPEEGSEVYLYWDNGDAVVMHTTEEKLYNLIERIPEIGVVS